MQSQINAMPEKQIILDVAPDTTQQLSKAQNSLVLADSFEIDSPEMFEAAGNEVKAVKIRLKEVIAKKESFTKPLNALKSQWIDFFRPAIETLEQVEAVYKNKMDAYFNEQERLRLEEEARAAELARKEQARIEEEARIEREKIEAEQRAEREKIQAEQNRIAEAARIEREKLEAKKEKSNEKKRLELEQQENELKKKQAEDKARFEQQEKELKRKQADEIEQHEEEVIFQESAVHQQVTTTQAPKAAGISRKITYKAELVSKMDLIKAIAAGEVPDIFVDVNMPLLNKQAKSLKEHMNIAGVKAVAESGIAVRTKH